MSRIFDRNNPIINRIKELSNIEVIKLLGFIFSIPVTLLLLQLSLFSIIIPMNIPGEYIQLSYENITFSGIFLSNYFHSIIDFNHIIGNFYSTLAIMTIMGFLYFIAIPAYKMEISKKFILKNLILILAIYPFIVSFVSVCFHNPKSEIQWSTGFSGLTYALLGFDFILILLIIYELKFREICNENIKKTIAGLLLISVFLILSPVWIFFLEKGGTINSLAHLTGYSFGLFIPLIIYLTEIKNFKNTFTKK